MTTTNSKNIDQQRMSETKQIECGKMSNFSFFFSKHEVSRKMKTSQKMYPHTQGWMNNNMLQVCCRVLPYRACKNISSNISRRMNEWYSRIRVWIFIPRVCVGVRVEVIFVFIFFSCSEKPSPIQRKRDPHASQFMVAFCFRHFFSDFFLAFVFLPHLT